MRGMHLHTAMTLLLTCFGALVCAPLSLGDDKAEQRRLWDEYVAQSGKARQGTEVAAVRVSLIEDSAAPFPIVVSDPGFCVEKPSEGSQPAREARIGGGRLWMLDNRLTRAQALDAPPGHQRFGQWHYAEFRDSATEVVVASEYADALWLTWWTNDTGTTVLRSSVSIGPPTSRILGVVIGFSGEDSPGAPITFRLLKRETKSLALVDVRLTLEGCSVHRVVEIPVHPATHEKGAVVMEDIDGDGVRDIVLAVGDRWLGRDQDPDAAVLRVHSGLDLGLLAEWFLDRGDPSLGFGEADVGWLGLHASPLDPTHVYLALLDAGCPSLGERRSNHEQVHRLRIPIGSAVDVGQRNSIRRSSIVAIQSSTPPTINTSWGMRPRSYPFYVPLSSWGSVLALTQQQASEDHGSLGLIVAESEWPKLARWRVTSGQKREPARSVLAPEVRRSAELARYAWGDSPGAGRTVVEGFDADADGLSDVLVVDFEPIYPAPELRTMQEPYAGRLRLSILSAKNFDCVRLVVLE